MHLNRLTACIILFTAHIAHAQDQLYLSGYQFSKGKAVLITGDTSFTSNKPVLKIDWVMADFGWLTGDFSLVPNIDWGGSVEAPDGVHGSLADVDFGLYVNPKKPVKILGSKTVIGLGIIGGFKTAGFRSTGITFPGAGFSILTKLGDRMVLNTRYHYTFFFNNLDQDYTGRNKKLQFNFSYKVADWFALMVSPNIEAFKVETRASGAAALSSRYTSLDVGVSFFWN